MGEFPRIPNIFFSAFLNKNTKILLYFLKKWKKHYISGEKKIPIIVGKFPIIPIIFFSVFLNTKTKILQYFLKKISTYLEKKNNLEKFLNTIFLYFWTQKLKYCNILWKKISKYLEIKIPIMVEKFPIIPIYIFFCISETNTKILLYFG